MRSILLNMRKVFLLGTMLGLMYMNQQSYAQTSSSFQKKTGLKEQYQILPLGEVRPTGWIKAQIQENLNGFTGHLDQLVPDLIVQDDIYGRNRLSKKVKNKDVGALGVAGDWQVQFLWWNSETQSNWWDGYIRSSILVNSSTDLKKCAQYIDRILSTQDKDGYIGIYDPELRYKFNGENGELWSKATLLRGLLAWYDYKKDPSLKSAIERAVKNIMDNYPAYASHPFKSDKPDVGGVTHGLMITDVFESMYRITGKDVYRDYCLFLYKDFSEQVLNEDAQYAKLVNENIALKGHSAHTYEHLRTVAAAYYASGNETLQSALEKFLLKIDPATSASGAAVGDEWIGGKKADATHRGYEYCSLQELMHSYLELFVKTGQLRFANYAEKIFLNPAQGARHQDGKSITYLNSDNAYYLKGGLNGDTSDQHQTRFRYSPVHKEAAVCCVPNAGRIAPYFVQHMWLKDETGFVNALPGPSELNTTLAGKPVQIVANTSYPHDFTIQYKVTARQQVFSLKIRVPEGVGSFKVSEAYTLENGFIVIRKQWNGTENVQVDFSPLMAKHQDVNGETFFTYGLLVLAAKIESIETRTKAYAVEGFYDLNHAPKSLVIYQYAGEPVQQIGDELRFKTQLWNPSTSKLEPVELMPMGQTILRQVTFKNATIKK